jgi:hypothetical protein
LTDVNLWPENEYNVTSAYGCYRKTDSATEGYDPNALLLNGVGCKASWQSINGVIIYSTFAPTTDAAATDGTQYGTITSVSGTYKDGRYWVDLEGPVEAQITVYLYDNARVL